MRYLYDNKKGKVITTKETIELSKKENEIFKILYKNAGVPLRAKKLAKLVYDNETREGIIPGIISSLRVKLSHVLKIYNISRMGYFIRRQEDE